MWADEGRDAAALTRFFDELGPERAAGLQAISIDMSAAYLKAIGEHDDVDATVCFDPFHVAQLANKALDVVRRGYWNELRDRAGRDDARRFKHARWALLKRPDHLTDTQHDQLAAIRRAGGEVWRSYRLKEALRAIFDPDLTPAEAAVLLDRWIAWRNGPGWRHSSSCNAPPQAPRRDPRALEFGIKNGRSEGLNRKVRSITSRAFGFHSAKAIAAMIMLCCGPIQLRLPHDKRSQQ